MGHSDLPRTRAISEVNFEMLLTLGLPSENSVEMPSSRRPSVLRASIAGGVGASEPVLAGEPNALTVSVASGSELPLVPLSKGKELTVSPRDEPTSKSFEESDSPIPRPPLVKPVWLSRPDTQPLFVEEMMTKAFIYATVPKD